MIVCYFYIIFISSRERLKTDFKQKDYFIQFSPVGI